jgi:hypothetical protein
MKEKLKKSLKLDKRTIRKLDVRSGLRGGKINTEYMCDPIETAVCDTMECTITNYCYPGAGVGGGGCIGKQ